jgi:hypothetical protein
MGRRMKRSEMVNIIEEALFHKVMDWEEENYKSDAGNIILSIIEEAGMLPPCHGYKEKHRDDIGYYEWEHEDV